VPYQAVSRALEDAEIWVSLEVLSEYRQVPLELLSSEKISRDQMKSLVAGIAAFDPKQTSAIRKSGSSSAETRKTTWFLSVALPLTPMS